MADSLIKRIRDARHRGAKREEVEHALYEVVGELARECNVPGRHAAKVLTVCLDAVRLVYLGEGSL